MDAQISESYLLERLESRNLQGFTSELSLYLSSLSTNVKGKKNIQNSSRNLAKKLSPFLIKVLKYCFNALGTNAVENSNDRKKTECKELIPSCILIINTLSSLRSVFTSRTYEVEIQRYNLVRKLIQLELYEDALNQAIETYTDICQFVLSPSNRDDNIEYNKPKSFSESWPSLSSPNTETSGEIVSLIVNTVLSISNCIAEDASLSANHLYKLPKLLEEVEIWIKKLEEKDFERSSDLLFIHIYKCAQNVNKNLSQYGFEMSKVVLNLGLSKCILSRNRIHFVSISLKLCSFLESTEFILPTYETILEKTVDFVLGRKFDLPCDFLTLIEYYARACIKEGKMERGCLFLQDINSRFHMIKGNKMHVLNGMFISTLWIEVLLEEKGKKRMNNINVNEHLQKFITFLNKLLQKCKTGDENIQRIHSPLIYFPQEDEIDRNDKFSYSNVSNNEKWVKEKEREKDKEKERENEIQNCFQTLNFFRKTFSTFSEFVCNNFFLELDDSFKINLEKMNSEKISDFQNIFFSEIENQIQNVWIIGAILWKLLLEKNKFKNSEIFSKVKDAKYGILYGMTSSLQISISKNKNFLVEIKLINEFITNGFIDSSDSKYVTSKIYNIAVNFYNLKNYQRAQTPFGLAYEISFARTKLANQITSFPKSNDSENDKNYDSLNDVFHKCAAFSECLVKIKEFDHAKTVIKRCLTQFGMMIHDHKDIKELKNVILNWVKAQIFMASDDMQDCKIEFLYFIFNDIFSSMNIKVIGFILEEEYKAYEFYEYKNESICKMAQKTIIDNLLQNIYKNGQENFIISRSRILLQQFRHVRSADDSNRSNSKIIEIFDEIIQILKSKMDVNNVIINNVHTKDGDDDYRIIYDILAITYCLRGLHLLESSAHKKSCLDDFEEAMALWRCIIPNKLGMRMNDMKNGENNKDKKNEKDLKKYFFSISFSFLLILSAADALALIGHNLKQREMHKLAFEIALLEKSNSFDQIFLNLFSDTNLNHTFCPSKFNSKHLCSSFPFKETWNEIFQKWKTECNEPFSHSLLQTQFLFQKWKFFPSHCASQFDEVQHCKEKKEFLHNLDEFMFKKEESKYNSLLKQAGVLHIVAESFLNQGCIEEAIKYEKESISIRYGMISHNFPQYSEHSFKEKKKTNEDRSGNNNNNNIDNQINNNQNDQNSCNETHFFTANESFHSFNRSENNILHSFFISPSSHSSFFSSSLLSACDSNNDSKSRKNHWALLSDYLESLYKMGIITELAGSVDDSLMKLKEGRKISSALNLPFLEVSFLSKIGEIYRKRQNWKMAETAFKEAIEIICKERNHDKIKKKKKNEKDKDVNHVMVECKSCYALMLSKLEKRMGDFTRRNEMDDSLLPVDKPDARDNYKSGPKFSENYIFASWKHYKAAEKWLSVLVPGYEILPNLEKNIFLKNEEDACDSNRYEKNDDFPRKQLEGIFMKEEGDEKYFDCEEGDDNIKDCEMTTVMKKGMDDLEIKNESGEEMTGELRMITVRKKKSRRKEIEEEYIKESNAAMDMVGKDLILEFEKENVQCEKKFCEVSENFHSTVSEKKKPFGENNGHVKSNNDKICQSLNSSPSLMNTPKANNKSMAKNARKNVKNYLKNENEIQAAENNECDESSNNTKSTVKIIKEDNRIIYVLSDSEESDDAKMNNSSTVNKKINAAVKSKAVKKDQFESQVKVKSKMERKKVDSIQKERVNKRLDKSKENKSCKKTNCVVEKEGEISSVTTQSVIEEEEDNNNNKILFLRPNKRNLKQNVICSDSDDSEEDKNDSYDDTKMKNKKNLKSGKLKPQKAGFEVSRNLPNLDTFVNRISPFKLLPNFEKTENRKKDENENLLQFEKFDFEVSRADSKQKRVKTISRKEKMNIIKEKKCTNDFLNAQEIDFDFDLYKNFDLSIELFENKSWKHAIKEEMNENLEMDIDMGQSMESETKKNLVDVLIMQSRCAMLLGKLEISEKIFQNIFKLLEIDPVIFLKDEPKAEIYKCENLKSENFKNENFKIDFPAELASALLNFSRLHLLKLHHLIYSKSAKNVINFEISKFKSISHWLHFAFSLSLQLPLLQRKISSLLCSLYSLHLSYSPWHDVHLKFKLNSNSNSNVNHLNNGFNFASVLFHHASVGAVARNQNLMDISAKLYSNELIDADDIEMRNFLKSNQDILRLEKIMLSDMDEVGSRFKNYVDDNLPPGFAVCCVSILKMPRQLHTSTVDFLKKDDEFVMISRLMSNKTPIVLTIPSSYYAKNQNKFETIDLDDNEDQDDVFNFHDDDDDDDVDDVDDSSSVCSNSESPENEKFSDNDSSSSSSSAINPSFAQKNKSKFKHVKNKSKIEEKTKERGKRKQMQKEYHSVKDFIDEFSIIMEECQQSSSHSSSKSGQEDEKEWWDGRRKVDNRLCNFLKEAEMKLFGPWKCLLLGEITNCQLAKILDEKFQQLYCHIMHEMQDLFGGKRQKSTDIKNSTYEILRLLFQGCDDLTNHELQTGLRETLYSFYCSNYAFEDSGHYETQTFPNKETKYDCPSHNLMNPPCFQSNEYRKRIKKIAEKFKTVFSEALTSFKKDREVKVQKKERKVEYSSRKVYSDKCQTLEKEESQKSNTFCFRRNPIELILDSKMQAIPWESIPVLRKHGVYRMPSLASIFVHLQHQKRQNSSKNHSSSINLGRRFRFDQKLEPSKFVNFETLDAKSENSALSNQSQHSLRLKSDFIDLTVDSEKSTGMISIPKSTKSRLLNSLHCIDIFKVFYLVNPSGDLKKTEARFSDWFQKQPGWKGKAGQTPDSNELLHALKESDLFVYCGHGSGEKYIGLKSMRKLTRCASSILMGCSSGRLGDRGDYEPLGVPLTYLHTGAPVIVANLWDVTDGDIDRLTVALLRQWVQHDGNSSSNDDQCVDYHEHDYHVALNVSLSRDACLLKYLIGSAPVCYGLPATVIS